MASLLEKKCNVQPAGEYKTLQLNISAPKPVNVHFSDITLTVSEGIKFISQRKKTILKGVSGHFKPGELTAIMGPSGAGKSSLLNALTGFSTEGVTGTIRIGDSTRVLEEKKSRRSLQAYRKKSCYILQDSELNPLFTVRELMKFAADFKLGYFTDAIKNTVIEEILETLDLTGTEETRCGNLSGGQKKRLSIAVELIDNPPVIYLDEPTTGLDSRTSVSCIEMLKKLAQKGLTVVCTVHQPSASLYMKFDQVYVLADGMCIYNGSSQNTVPYLASIGLMCPKYHNPADYIIEVASKEYGNFNEILSEKNIKQDWCAKTLALSSDTEEELRCEKMSLIINPPQEVFRFGVLLRRCLIQLHRDWTVTHLRILLHVSIGILLGLFYGKIGNDGSRSVHNIGYLIISIAYLMYTSVMPGILRFPSELTVLKKETFNNWYSIKAYYIAVLVTSTPLQVVFSVMYIVPSYLLTGQPLDLFRILIFVLVLVQLALFSDTLGNVIGTCVNPVNGTFLGAIIACTLLAFAGFLILISHMNIVMKTISYFSLMRYTFEALFLAVYDYDRPLLDCPEKLIYCHYRYPKELLKEFSFKSGNYWINIAIVFLGIIALRIIAYFTLRRAVKRH